MRQLRKLSSGTMEEKFWSRAIVKDGCWGWDGFTTKFGVEKHDGYGWVSIDGNQVGAHRVSWMIHNGPIPQGMQVLHRCDNPPCTNPAHLFLGTPADNVADMMAKGRDRKRGLRGELSQNAKLSATDVVDIRSRCGAETQVALAAEFGVTQTQIWRIINRITWRHI